MQFSPHITKRLNIRTRMLLVCLGIAAPLMAIGCFSLWKEYKTLNSEAQRATAAQVATAARTVIYWLNSEGDAIRSVAAIPAIQSINPDTTKKILTSELQTQPGWMEVTLFDPQGIPQISTVEESSATSVAARISARKLIKQIVSTNQPQMSDYTTAPMLGKPAILVGAPVAKADRLGGVLVAAIKPDSVHNLFTGLGDSSGSNITVLDRHNRVICRTIANDYFQGKDFSQAKTTLAAAHTDKGTVECVGIADQIKRAYAFERLPNGWLVDVGVPTDSIYGVAHEWLFIMLVLASSAIGLSVLLALQATAYFTKTINVLVREALAIGRGDFSKRVEVPAADELGLLARAFNEMAVRLEMDQEQKSMVEKLSEAIRHSLDLDEILTTTVRELGTALGASRVCLALLDNKTTADLGDDELVFNYVWCDPSRNGHQLSHRSILITSNSVLRTILDQGAILSLDILDEGGPTPLFENSQKSPDDWRTIRSLIACPITTSDGPKGMILVHQCDRLRVWTDSELELVEAVTRHVTLAMEHAHLYNRTKRLAEQEILINHIVRSMRSSLDLDTILNTVTRELGIALNADRLQIAQPRKEGPLVVTHEFHQKHIPSGKGLSLYPDNLVFHPNMGSLNEGRNTLLGINLERLSENPDYPDNARPDNKEGDTLKEAPLAVITNVFQDSRAVPFKEFLDNCGAQSIIAAPLLNENRLVGVLLVHQCDTMRDWSASEVQLVASIADQVAIAISHAHLFAQVKYQAITDGLTGLYNHIYFKNRLGEELRMAQRKGTSCSLLMIDLDKLKVINDRFGHPVGDAAIRQISQILKTLLRSGDTAARYGGEEFAVILPETTLLEAALIADRLCTQIRNTPVPGLGRSTASIGAASYPKHAGSLEDLVEKADKALYVAKNSGRDQVRIFEPEQTPIDFPSSSTWVAGEKLDELKDKLRDS